MGRIFTDTSDFYAIDYGDEIHLGEHKRYRVLGNAKELRFGIEDPKFWVKQAIDIDTNEKKIIKLVYFEAFETTLGGVKIKCFRNPEKEGLVLDFVKNHPYFMQGDVYNDPQGNNIRVLDIIRGTNLFAYIDGLQINYETYYRDYLPGILKNLVKAFEAIRHLHSNGLKHGDIRNDHIIIEHATGNYVWIDFDYDYEATENPFSLDIFGLGNVLLYTVGKGFHNLYMIDADRNKYGDLAENLYIEDFSLLDKWRYVNMRNIYPMIPSQLNDILMHFSRGTDVYYELVEEIIEDLNRCIFELF